jgi:hypothetical protein
VSSSQAALASVAHSAESLVPTSQALPSLVVVSRP